MASERERTLAIYQPSLVLPVMQFLPLVVLSVAYAALADGPMRWAAPLLVLLVLAMRVLYRLQFSWRLSDERLIAHRGILIRDTTVLRFDNITDMHVRKPMLAILFGTGSVRVSTAGSDGYQITVFGQHHAGRVERSIANARRAYRERYRPLHDPHTH